MMGHMPSVSKNHNVRPNTRLIAVVEYAKQHRIQFISTLFAIVIVLIVIWRPSTINQYYELAFSRNAENGSSIEFRFDPNKGFSESAKQTAFIEQAHTQQAILRVDPLNKDSQSLSITVPGNNVQLSQFRSTVRLDGTTLYTTTSIPGSRIQTLTNQHGHTDFIFTAAQLKTIQTQSRLLSEIKVFFLCAAALLYVIALARITVFSRTDVRFFAAGTIIAMLIVGFMCNVAFIQQPLIAHDTSASPSTQDIDQSQSYSVSQSFSPEKKIEDIEFPVTITNDVNPENTDDSYYSSVYRTTQEFVDDYRVSITSGNGAIVYYAGRVTPLMLNGDLSDIVVPAVIAKNAGRVNVKLVKTSSDTKPTLIFRGTAQSGSTPFSGSRSSGLEGRSIAYLNLIPGYRGFPYQLAIILILLVFLIALLINLWGIKTKISSRARRGICAADYAGVFIYAIAQFPVYVHYIGGFPDEEAHISYIAFLKKNQGWIPDFPSMQIYDTTSNPGTIDLSIGKGFNYLGHPPLYYQLLRVIGRMSVNGNTVHYSLNYLRMVSFAIGLLALALIFYIGFTRISKLPILHLLFALVVVSPPNLLYCMSGVNNDTLALLTVSIFVLGIIRFVEHRYNAYTYILIALGISASFLTKLTAGLIVGITGVAVLAYSLVSERHPRRVFKPAFWISFPVYFVPGIYFAMLFSRFHTLQPSYARMAYSEYVHTDFYSDILSRGEMGVWQFVTTLADNFIGTWYNLAGGTGIPRGDYPIYSIDRIAVISVLLLPLILFFAFKGQRIANYLKCGLFAMVCAFLLQSNNVYQSFMVNGRFGGYSSRYYLCGISILALSYVFIVSKLFVRGRSDMSDLNDISAISTEEEKTITPIGQMVISCVTLLLVFDGFIYSVLYSASEIAGFQNWQ